MTTRICKICGLEKEAVQGIWAMAYGKPVGRACRQCKNEQQQQERATPEGRAKTNVATRKANKKRLSTEEGRVKHNAASVTSMAKRLKTDAWFRLRKKLADETWSLVHALVNGTSNRDMRFLRLFGHSRAEVLAHITSQCHAKGLRLSDYQVTWQLDHRDPVALATDSNELVAMFKLANCQVLTMEEHAIKTVVDNARVRELEHHT